MYDFQISQIEMYVFIHHMYRYEKTAKMMTLGSYPKLNLAEARTKAAKAKEEVSKGIDPGKSWVEKKREDRKSPTVEGLVD